MRLLVEREPVVDLEQHGQIALAYDTAREPLALHHASGRRGRIERLQLRSWAAVPVLIIAWLFQLLTVPVSAHMVGRAGYRTKHLHRETLSVDDLDAVVQKAADEEAERRKADAEEEAALAADPELAAELDASGNAEEKPVGKLKSALRIKEPKEAATKASAKRRRES